MKRFRINLASRPFRNNTLHWTGLAVVVALLSLFTWYNVTNYQAAGGDLERWMEALQEHRRAIADMDREIARMKGDVASLDLVSFSERSNFANEIILSRLFSWTSLFDRLEKIMPPKVRLRSIRPSLGKEMIEITVDGMTPNHSALLDFEEALIASEYFTFVYPVQESSKVRQGEINFSVTFGYLPEGGDSTQVPMPFADVPPPPEAVEEAAGAQAAPQEGPSPASAREDRPQEPSPARAAGDQDDAGSELVLKEDSARRAARQAAAERAVQGRTPGKAPGKAAGKAGSGTPSRAPGTGAGKAAGKAPGKAGGRETAQPPRSPRANRPPAPPEELRDESVEQDPNGDPNDQDPNIADPNVADPNVSDPNEDDDGGRP